MADDPVSSSSAKIKFGFSKKLETKIKPTVHSEPISIVQSVEFVTTLEDSKIVSENSKEANGDLVIPLIRRNKWVIRPATSTTENKTEITLTAEDTAAAAEILKDVEKLQNGAAEEDSGLEIPLWMQNRLPATAEGPDEKLKVDMHADESTLEDYEQIPVEKYGLAMLRGMGWKEDEGIGKTNKQVTKPLEVNIRPRGLGLGAVPVKEKQKAMQKDAAEKAEKTLAIGSYVEITQGRDQGRTGKVTQIDRLTERWTVMLVGEEKRLVSVLEINLTEITESQYKKAGKYLNNDKYHDYKLVQEEKLSQIRRQVEDDEDRRAKRKDREAAVKQESSPNDDIIPVWQDGESRRNERERRKDRESHRSKRKRRSASRSRSPERRRRK